MVHEPQCYLPLLGHEWRTSEILIDSLSKLPLGKDSGDGFDKYERLHTHIGPTIDGGCQIS